MAKMVTDVKLKETSKSIVSLRIWYNFYGPNRHDVEFRVEGMTDAQLKDFHRWIGKNDWHKNTNVLVFTKET